MTPGGRLPSILHLIAETEIPDSPKDGDERAYWIYRVYDFADRLLYIGCTDAVVSRFQVHSCSWHNPASAAINCYGARIKVDEPIIGKSKARQAEREAIGTEAPLLNKLHNRGRSILRDVETWLAAERELRAARDAYREAIENARGVA